MGKPNMYGMRTAYNPKLWRGAKDRRRQKPRPREASTPKPVAGLIVKKKEAEQ